MTYPHEELGPHRHLRSVSMGVVGEADGPATERESDAGVRAFDKGGSR